jgi:hypothetical protein
MDVFMCLGCVARKPAKALAILAPPENSISDTFNAMNFIALFIGKSANIC